MELELPRRASFGMFKGDHARFASRILRMATKWLSCRAGTCYAENATVYQTYDIQRQRNEDGNTIFEMVRRAEGADQCPVCRQMSHTSVEARAQNYYPGSGATSGDAIVID